MMRALLELSSHASLSKPDEVLTCVAKKNVKDSFKANLVDFYKHYADFNQYSKAWFSETSEDESRDTSDADQLCKIKTIQIKGQIVSIS